LKVVKAAVPVPVVAYVAVQAPSEALEIYNEDKAKQINSIYFIMKFYFF